VRNNLKFQFPVKLCSSGINYQFTEFDFLVYKEIQKTMVNNSVESFYNHIINIIKSCSIKNIDKEIHNFSFLDIMYIFLNIYSNSVTFEKEYTNWMNGVRANIKIDIYEEKCFV